MAKFTKEQKSWILYDWANSAYSITVTSTVLPLYFKDMANAANISGATSTAYLGYANSFATLMLFLLSPILGTIADYQNVKKKLFVFFAAMGVCFTVLLAFVPSSDWFMLLIVYIFTVLGFSGANIFYDSFLTDVADDKSVDRVSTYGFALGYIGSTIPFMLSLGIIMLAQFNVIPMSVTLAMQISFIITALWWGIFTLPMLKHVEQKYGIPREEKFISKSFVRLWDTFKNIVLYKKVFIFLLAYFFYIDGVDTIIKMATSYGSDLGIDNTTLLLVLLVTQFVAFPFAIIYSYLAEKYSNEVMILVAIVVYMCVCIYALFINSATGFWILAISVGTSQGGIQALSRSYFSKIIPKEKSSQFFGFYNIFGKFAAIMGPLLLGVTTQITGNTKYGVFSIILLFLVGGFIFYRSSFNKVKV